MATAKQSAASSNPLASVNPLAPASELPLSSQAGQSGPVGNDQPNNPVSQQDSELASLRNRLAAMEQQIAEKDLRNEQLEAEKKALTENAMSLGSSRTGSFERSMATTRNKPTFKFEVSVANNADLPKLTITAVDESEAIRLYALKASPGKVLETTNCSWKVTCLEAALRMQTWRESKAKRMQERGHDVPMMSMVG